MPIFFYTKSLSLQMHCNFSAIKHRSFSDFCIVCIDRAQKYWLIFVWQTIIYSVMQEWMKWMMQCDEEGVFLSASSALCPSLLLHSPTCEYHHGAALTKEWAMQKKGKELTIFLFTFFCFITCAS